jgi:phenylalanyl-tRNA synthetase beta subunit
VTVPAWRRGDVEREADLIEEVARIWGLDRIPATLPSRRGAVGRLAPEQRIRRRAEDALTGAGLSEAVGWSFTSPDVARRLGMPEQPIVLENPMSEEQSVMRTTLRALRIDWRVEPGGDEPFLHPRRAATVYAGERRAGWLGELHPSVAGEWDLDGAAGFELDFGALAVASNQVPRYEDLTSFPAVRQDIAVVVPDDVPAARVLELIRGAGGALLRGAEVFDVYRGAQVGEGRASLAIRMEFRAADRTLTDDDVGPRREKIVAALRDEVGGELRG